MTVELLRSFFMWCTIINGGLYLLAVLMCTFATDWVYKMHSYWFPLPRESFNTAIYAFIGAMKLFVLMFNLVPYIALVIIS